MKHKNVHFCKCLHNAEAVDLGPQLWAPPPHWAAPATLTFKFGRNEDIVLKWQRENKTPHLITCLRNTNSILISALDQRQQRSCSPEKTCKNRTAAHLYSRLASKRLLHSESSGLLPSSFSVKYFQRLLILKCLVHYLLSNMDYLLLLWARLPLTCGLLQSACCTRQPSLLTAEALGTRLLSCTFQSASHLGLFPLNSHHHLGVFIVSIDSPLSAWIIHIHII